MGAAINIAILRGVMKDEISSSSQYENVSQVKNEEKALLCRPSSAPSPFRLDYSVCLGQRIEPGLFDMGQGLFDDHEGVRRLRPSTSRLAGMRCVGMGGLSTPVLNVYVFMYACVDVCMYGMYACQVCMYVTHCEQPRWPPPSIGKCGCRDNGGGKGRVPVELTARIAIYGAPFTRVLVAVREIQATPMPWHWGGTHSRMLRCGNARKEERLP